MNITPEKDPSMEIRGQIWELTGLDVGSDDPVLAFGVIFQQAKKDFQQMLDQHAQEQRQALQEQISTQTEGLLKPLKTCVNEISQTVLKENLHAIVQKIDADARIAERLHGNFRRLVLWQGILTFLTVSSALAHIIVTYQ